MENAGIVEYVTSWEERGMAKGLEQGIVERRAEGRAEALREMLLDVLNTRFAPVAAGVAARIQHMDSTVDLKDLFHRALAAASLQELGLDALS